MSETSGLSINFDVIRAYSAAAAQSQEHEQLQQQAREQTKQLLGMEHILQSQKLAFAEEQQIRQSYLPRPAGN